MVCGGGRERFWPGRFRGNGRQGCHFHNEVFDSVAEGSAGCFEQGCLVQPEPGSPGRTRREKHKPSVAQIREATFAGKRVGQVVAQFSIEQIQGARAYRERVEGDALRNRLPSGRWLEARWTTSLHGGTYSANSQ